MPTALTAQVLSGGVDTSAELLELAHANALMARFVHASAYEVQIRGSGAVVALGEPLTYHAEGTNAVCP